MNCHLNLEECFSETIYPTWLKIQVRVCNTDPSSEHGDHWSLHTTEGVAENFDSLCGAISHDEFGQFLDADYIYVSVQTQELLYTFEVNIVYFRCL